MSADRPDLAGWDRDRDGLMADYDVPIEVEVEDYDPAKDPVTRGLVADPYGGEPHDRN